MANVNVGGVYATFRAQNQQLLRATQQNVAALRRTRRGFEQTGRAVNAFRGIALRGIGVFAALTGTITGLSSTLRSGLNVDSSFARLQTLVGLSADEANRLRVQLQEISEIQGLNLEELSAGAFTLASAGIQVDNIAEVITAASKAAVIGLGTTEQVANALTTTLGAWGDAAADAETETAILTATVRVGRIETQNFVRQWSRVAAFAPLIGATSRETGALFATLSRRGFTEEAAGTAIRTLFAQLNRPPQEAVKAFQQLGITFDDIRKSIQQRGLLETLIQLQAQFQEVGLDITTAFRSQEVAGALGALVNNVDDAREVFAELGAVTRNELQKAFDTASDTVSGRFTIAMNKLKANLNNFAEVVLSPIVTVFEALVDNLDKVRFVALALGAVLLRQLYFSTAAATALTFAKGLVTATGAMAALTAATAFLRTALIRLGFGVIIVAIGEAVYQTYRFVDAMGGIRNAFQAVIGVGKEVFERILFNLELLAVNTEIEFLKARIAVINTFKAIPAFARSAVDGVVRIYSSAVNAIKIAWDVLPDIFKAIFDKVVNFAKSAVNTIISSFQKALNFVASFLGIELPEFLQLPEFEVDEEGLATKLRRAVDNARQYLRGGAEVVRRAIENAFDTDAIREQIDTAYFKREIAELSEAERRVAFTTIIDSFKEVGASSEEAAAEVEKLKESIDTFQIGSGATGAGAGGESRIEQAKVELTDMQQRLKNLSTDIGRAFGDFASSAISNFRDIGEAARELGRVIVDSIINKLIAGPIADFVAGGLGSLFGIPGLQDGGLGRGLTLVGEAGPELVDFRRPGRVYSNEDLANALDNNGGGNVFNFAPVINSSDPVAVNRALAEAYPIFETRVLSRLQLDARRRSSLRQSIRG